MPGSDALGYYAGQGPFTDPERHATIFDDLPADLSALCGVVQGLVIHFLWAKHYGVEATDERRAEMEIRPVSRKLEYLMDADPRPLGIARDPRARMLGTCRDFSVILCGMLRHRGIPARVRCGFATYFEADHFEDHWIVQYWRPTECRWAMVDAQLDALHREHLHIDFDTTDIPAGRFLSGGRAWRMCRDGKADPEKFGILGMSGMWFIRGDVVRDLLALNKLEVSPWDRWRLVAKGDDVISDAEVALTDHIAAVTQGEEIDIAAVRALYESVDDVHLPPWLR
ncbi:MAG: transglutaminase domain-containing protein [Candidatus Rokubacteria bacterium]|nr:transglutaminase domain-containing protein [Candidatus Rokubacteria bacterium]